MFFKAQNDIRALATCQHSSLYQRDNVTGDMGQLPFPGEMYTRGYFWLQDQIFFKERVVSRNWPDQTARYHHIFHSYPIDRDTWFTKMTWIPGIWATFDKLKRLESKREGQTATLNGPRDKLLDNHWQQTVSCCWALRKDREGNVSEPSHLWISCPCGLIWTLADVQRDWSTDSVPLSR